MPLLELEVRGLAFERMLRRVLDDTSWFSILEVEFKPAAQASRSNLPPRRLEGLSTSEDLGYLFKDADGIEQMSKISGIVHDPEQTLELPIAISEQGAFLPARATPEQKKRVLQRLKSYLA